MTVRSELLGQFLNTLTADYNYSREKSGEFIATCSNAHIFQLKFCSRFFIAFLKSTLNFEYLEEKDQSQRLSFTKIINCETGSYLNV